MKTLLKIVIVLIVAILVYNYFAGTPSEKKQSEKIFREIKEVGNSVADLVKDEHKKFQEGKYDNILEKLKTAYADMERAWGETKPELMDKLHELEKKRDELEEASENPRDSVDTEKLKRDLKELLKDTEKLLEEN